MNNVCAVILESLRGKENLFEHGHKIEHLQIRKKQEVT
jgi:hypothetical protein